jgi:hypothetical protein
MHPLNMVEPATSKSDFGPPRAPCGKNHTSKRPQYAGVSRLRAIPIIRAERFTGKEILAIAVALIPELPADAVRPYRAPGFRPNFSAELTIIGKKQKSRINVT